MRPAWLLIGWLVLASAARGALSCAAEPLRIGSLPKEYESILAKNPHLLREGYATEEKEDGTWKVVAVGSAANSARTAEGTYTAWLGATHRAMRHLLEAAGAGRHTMERHARFDGNGTEFRSKTVFEAAGALSGAREAGRWVDGESGDCHVMLVCSGPGHAADAPEGMLRAERVELPEPWRNEFLSRPALGSGGCALALVAGVPRLLTTVRIPLEKGTREEVVNASRTAGVLAQKAALLFCRGMNVRAEETASEFWRDGRDESGDTVESGLRQQVTVSKVGLLKGMRPVGDWRNIADDAFIKAFVLDLE